MILLRHWYVSADAPGLLRLRGVVYGHDRHPMGTEVVTSVLIASDGWVALTASGTTYQLGAPAPFAEGDQRALLRDAFTNSA